MSRPPNPRSPLAHESTASSSSSSSSSSRVAPSLAERRVPTATSTTGGGGPASPPYLSMHTSRMLHTAGSESATPLAPPVSSASRPPPPLRIPTSPARAHTHRTLSAGTQQPSYPYLQNAARDAAQTPPPKVNHATVAAASPSTAAPTTGTTYAAPLPSPCFVHSHLDPVLNASAAGGGGTATIKARKKARARPAELAQDAVARRTGGDGEAAEKTPTRGPAAALPEDGSGQEADDDDDGEDTEGDEGPTSEDERNTWTRQLAETAVSVREMSRQLGQCHDACAARHYSGLHILTSPTPPGRARVVSHIQSVMIVTKARDNQLTKLTRELAVWLMKTPRDGKDRGLVVYVRRSRPTGLSALIDPRNLYHDIAATSTRNCASRNASTPKGSNARTPSYSALYLTAATLGRAHQLRWPLMPVP